MPSKQQFISCGVVTLAVLAIVFRVDMARELVTGLKTAAGADPKTPRALYV